VADGKKAALDFLRVQVLPVGQKIKGKAFFPGQRI
jgi:hypothetical protein